MKSILKITEFPQPSMIHINGIELEVFEAGQQKEYSANATRARQGYD